jgi:glucosylceramidase
MHASPLLKTLIALALGPFVAACGGGGSDVNITTPNGSAPAPAPGPVAPSPTGGGIDPSKWYQVINTSTNKCVDGTDSNAANATPIQQWTCSAPAAANQQWQFRPTDSGFYQVVGRYVPGSGWDVEGGAAAFGDGALIHLWAYIGANNQQWQPIAQGTDSYRLVARQSGKCLDVPDLSTADGARLQQWACTGAPAQTFRLVPQP